MTVSEVEAEFVESALAGCNFEQWAMSQCGKELTHLLIAENLNLKDASRWNECSNGPRSNCEHVRSSGGVSEAQDVEL